MKTQISRDGYRREKRYSGVYQQQGRLITDSDWNELVDTLKSRVDETLVDVIGSGAPKGRAATIQMVNSAPKIKPGVVYADGIEARIVAAPGVTADPFDYAQQADFPSPPPPVGTAYLLYADVWERPVVSLEDDDLRDPALHGADTCTRTQVMAQVKWCPTTVDPQSNIPARGNAPLTLAFPQGGTQSTIDPCDPQTQEVDPVGGDFLFRVEVHDVQWKGAVIPAAPDRLVLKWSRENGAEQYAFEDLPEWFSSGPWRYEMFSVGAEKHLGLHYANDPNDPDNSAWLQRGSLTAELPSTAPAQGTLVRRWDGYCVLERSGSTWAISTKAGESAQDTAPGADVQVAGGVLTARLTDLEVTVPLSGNVFLPGDFWTAPVRRATFEAGAKLLDRVAPSGIVHRYVWLGTVNNGQLVARTPREQHRLSFPRLTDLDAEDLSYSTTCTSGLFDNTHDTVKKALDRLCSLAAQHVRYAKPQDKSVYKGTNPATVAQALDLLADLRAEHNSYTTSKDSSIHDVRQALDALFNRRAGTGNRYTIGNGGDFGTIEDAVAALADSKEVALALLPGTHFVSGAVTAQLLPGTRFSLSGLGVSTRVYSSNTLKLNDLDLFELDRVVLTIEKGALDISGYREVLLKDSWIESQYLFTRDALVKIAVGQAEAAVTLRGCILDVQPSSPDPYVGFLLGEILDGDALFGQGLSGFRTDLATIMHDLASIPVSGRKLLAQGLQQRLTDGPGEGPPRGEGGPAPSFDVQGPTPASIGEDWASANLPPNQYTLYTSMVQLLGADTFNADSMASIFERLRRDFQLAVPGTALSLIQGRIATMIEDCDVRGWIGLYGDPGINALDQNTIWARQKGNIYSYGMTGADLELRNNRLIGIRFADSMTSWLQQPNPNNTPISIPEPFRSIVLTDNRIDGASNTVLARHIQVTSTELTSSTSALGWMIAETGVYMGNHGASTASNLTDLTRFVSAVASLRLNLVRLA